MRLLHKRTTETNTLEYAREYNMRYEDAAEPVKVVNANGDIVVEGWLAAGRFFNDEHAARYFACDGEIPCKTEGCNNRTRKGLMFCTSCEARIDSERWASVLEKNGVDWDGSLPLAEWMGDRYFFDEDSIQDYLDGLDSPSDARLTTTRQVEPRYFEVDDFLSDDLPEDMEIDGKDINRTVNEWISANVPPIWMGTGIPIRPKSLIKD